MATRKDRILRLSERLKQRRLWRQEIVINFLELPDSRSKPQACSNPVEGTPEPQASGSSDADLASRVSPGLPAPPAEGAQSLPVAGDGHPGSPTINRPVARPKTKANPPLGRKL
jgi:hypothetical protein